MNWLYGGKGTGVEVELVERFFSPRGVRHKRVEMEVSIMRQLLHHKNILQLLDWNTSEGERQNTPVMSLLSSCERANPPSLCVRRTLHPDHGVREPRHSEDLPADPQDPPEHRP